MPVRPRQTFLMESGPQHNLKKRHLHIVCFDVDDNGDTMIVPVTSYIDTKSDPACVFESYEHSFFNHKSCIDYKESKIIQSAKLEKGIREKNIICRDDMNKQAFLKVIKGVDRSEDIPRYIKNYFKTRM